jgi:hypothetical protein
VVVESDTIKPRSSYKSPFSYSDSLPKVRSTVVEDEGEVIDI